MSAPGTVIWLTGLSGAGKSTIARLLAAELDRAGTPTEVLDGDEVRAALSTELGFAKRDRDTQVRRVGYLAKLLARHGVTVIVALISPYREARDAVRASLGPFLEVHIRAPLDELINRDPKGLYRRALAGEISGFTGISDPYEPPLHPELVIDTDLCDPDTATARILALLQRSADTGSDHILAGDLAAAAGKRLLDLRAEQGFDAPDDLREAGDKQAHAFLADRIAEHRPGDQLRSEESPGDGTGSRLWIVDPLDGTREFGEPDRSDWAVHVALWRDGKLAAGAVALPARDLLLTTRDAVARPRSPGRFRIAVSRTRPPALAEALAAELDGDLVPMGSAGVKIVSVLLGDTDLYVHGGGQHEWDSAAPVAVATAAGLHASRLDGSALVYGRPDAWLPDLLVCRPDDADRVLAAVRAVSALEEEKA
ncbi:adenylyl-sulfate kinase [Actinokineospora diospyrosa]|uniref:Adenylyl-sulfate kinase n=1 Tax=Actinokineospora diospyrosa TaxID=103728 RepID=A0ABT1IBQ9_9PSEU|nr:adenylyl-sulfate kinase [Actinokineospora diospyrosa]MCP2270072.1 adenylyl-sulfate kinase [Actinokineospora diospyrosa]